jgi:hypothetical protein
MSAEGFFTASQVSWCIRCQTAERKRLKFLNFQLRVCIFYWILFVIVGQSSVVALTIGEAIEPVGDRPLIPDRPERSTHGQRLQTTDVRGVGETLPMPIGEAIGVIADRLEAEQIKSGGSAGIWPGEALYTGSIVGGMVSAYELMGDPNYRTSAELGGDYILWAAQGEFYGDEALALKRLSQIASDPCDNLWRTAVSDFYCAVKNDVNGTEGYISQFIGTEPSTAVFYLANYVVAAYYVDAEDKQIWREGLISYLAQVDDDTSDFPVLALGIATWSLAQTGDMNDTLIDPNDDGRPYWDGVTLADLPGLLLGHQVPPGIQDAGSFYWRFDHGYGGSASAVSGYTEDTIFGTLGLVAAFRANPDFDIEEPILAARQVLLGGVYEGGVVYEHLWLKGAIYYTYAGEMLQVLSEFIPGDLNLDGGVNLIDFAIFANSWCDSGCAPCLWCNHADIDQSGEVNYVDLKIMANNWLKGFSQ